MTTHQKRRNRRRQPVEVQLREELQVFAPVASTIEIEVHDHDGIRGGVIWVDLQEPMVAVELKALQGQMADVARARIPKDHPLVTWSMVFRHSGTELSVTHWFDE